MTQSITGESQIVRPSERERLERTAERYRDAFPSARENVFRAHLAIVRSGTSLARAVTAFLGANYDINQARYSLLRALYFAEESRLSQSDLARELGVTSPNVTQLIDALEHEGFVERVVSETDRRVTYARLTSAGEKRCKDIVPAMAAFMEEGLSVLTPEELLQLTSILAKFRDNLSQKVEAE